MALPKLRADDLEHDYPWAGGRLSLPLFSADKKESFLLDIWRSGNIELKGRYQNRARGVIALARLDFGGSPHRNPDETEVPCPHLHVYKEGFGDKWAQPVPLDKFSRPNDLWKTMEDFIRFCNIISQPIIVRGLLG